MFQNNDNSSKIRGVKEAGSGEGSVGKVLAAQVPVLSSNIHKKPGLS